MTLNVMCEFCGMEHCPHVGATSIELTKEIARLHQSIYEALYLLYNEGTPTATETRRVLANAVSPPDTGEAP